ncbi:MAG: terminase [Gemmatimonadales bacterium]|nr:terminase [Gemmatimonadales bacterium]
MPSALLERWAFGRPAREALIADALGAATVALGRVIDPESEGGSLLRPQSGPQTQFHDCRADIAFMGGSVFGGKTWILTYEPTRHVGNAQFTCVTFRRTKPDIRNPGSLWDESVTMYPAWDAVPKEQPMEWVFPSGARVKFDGLQYENDVLSWKGAQIALLQFDQVEEFTEHQFWYMQSRNRSTSGIRPYTRGTCNALADTWVADFIQWWWDPDTGYVIADRSGVTRWFLRVNDEIHWAAVTCRCDAPAGLFAKADLAAKTELDARFPDLGRFARSFAFIRAGLTDNPIGTGKDPDYEGKVRSMSLVEQERLLGGNWKIRAAAGLVFDRAWFDIVDAIPRQVRGRVRYWDKAGTAGGGDWTVGTRESWGLDGIFYIEDVVRGQWQSGDREKVIRDTAHEDATLGPVKVGVEQEPGSGGKDSALLTVHNLPAHEVRADRPTGQLVERAQPLSAQAGVRNVKLVRGPWNEAWLREMHAFPTKGVPDDQVASVAGAHKLLTAAPYQRAIPSSYSYVTG